MDSFDFEKAFKHERFYLNIFGLYPGQKTSFVGELATQYIYIVLAMIQLCLASIQLFINTDLTILIDCGIFFMSMTNFFCKAIVLHVRKDVLVSITKYLEAIDGFKVPGRMRHMLEQHEVLRGIFGTVYRIAISSFIFVQVLIVIVQEEKTFLPLKSWTPFDLNTNSVYYPTVIFQLSIVGILILCDTSLDCLYYIVADVACCQLDILKENLREIDSRGDLNVEHELIMCIKYHQDIIRFVHQIEQVFSVPLFLEFFKSIVNICFVGFELTMVNFFSLHFLVRLIFLNGSLMQIFSFCWFGHALILKSSEVEDACYVIEWNECSLSEQKLILMIMMRAQKPLAVRALFLTLTMSTLTLILKTSYSYCTVLRTMYD